MSGVCEWKFRNPTGSEALLRNIRTQSQGATDSFQFAIKGDHENLVRIAEDTGWDCGPCGETHMHNVFLLASGLDDDDSMKQANRFCRAFVDSFPSHTTDIYEPDIEATIDGCLHLTVIEAQGLSSDDTDGKARQSPSSLKVRFLPVSQYLLELASGVWVLECGMLTSREA